MYGPWQPCWISNQHQKQKSGRGPSSEHFWQVWLISVQRFQRRRFKCEKLTDGVLYQIFVFGADLKSNMAARVHNVFSLAEILKIFLSETTKSIEL
jgi:hypothetical protein